MYKILLKIMKMFGISYHKSKCRSNKREEELMQKAQQLHYTTEEERAERKREREELVRLGLVRIIR